MHDWTQNTTTQAEVKVFILDSLWQSLPRPPFTDEDTEALAGRVYDYVWQRSASGHGLHAAQVGLEAWPGLHPSWRPVRGSSGREA